MVLCNPKAYINAMRVLDRWTRFAQERLLYVLIMYNVHNISRDLFVSLSLSLVLGTSRNHRPLASGVITCGVLLVCFLYSMVLIWSSSNVDVLVCLKTSTPEFCGQCKPKDYEGIVRYRNSEVLSCEEFWFMCKRPERFDMIHWQYYCLLS